MPHPHFLEAPLRSLITTSLALSLMAFGAGCATAPSAGSGAPSADAEPSATIPVPMDRAAATAACDAGDLGACTDLAWAMRFGLAGPSDPAGAISLLSPACEQGSARACAHLGGMLLQGEGTPPDVPRGATLLEAGCNAEVWDACTELAAALSAGSEHAPAEPELAARLFLKLTEGLKTQGAAAVPYTPPFPVVSLPPEFPSSMKLAGLNGEIVVLVQLDDHGDVVKAMPPDAQLLAWNEQNVGQDLIDSVMESFESDWSYRPAAWRGQPIPSTIEQKFVFKLQ